MKQEKEKKISLNGGPKIKVKRESFFKEEAYLRLYDENIMAEEDENATDIIVEMVESMRFALMRKRPNCRNPLMVAMTTFGIKDYSNYNKMKIGREKRNS